MALGKSRGFWEALGDSRIGAARYLATSIESIGQLYFGQVYGGVLQVLRYLATGG